MEHTKEKFLMELRNFFTNFPEYSVGDVMYALYNRFEHKRELLDCEDESVIEELEKAQFVETEN